MKKVHKERLLKLANFIENLPDKAFNLDVITEASSKEEFKELTKKKYNCGTACCAIGWMPAVFPRQCRWTFVKGNEFFEIDDEVSVSLKNDEDYTDISAAEKFFGLDYFESTFLFMPESYEYGRKGKKSVARRIRRFVENGMPDNYGTSTYLRA